MRQIGCGGDRGAANKVGHGRRFNREIPELKTDQAEPWRGRTYSRKTAPQLTLATSRKTIPKRGSCKPKAEPCDWRTCQIDLQNFRRPCSQQQNLAILHAELKPFINQP